MDEQVHADIPVGEPVPGEMPQMLWYSGRYRLNIRTDSPAEPGETFDVHAHVHDEEGNELVVVNLDGTARHGVAGTLHPDDARTLRALAYRIPDDRVIR